MKETTATKTAEKSTDADKPFVLDTKADAAAIDRLTTARIGMLLRAPFFGNLVTRLRLVNADDWCSTAATDGRRFYYNSAFINSLPLRQLEFLCCHEILHVVYGHLDRRQDRDPKLSNIAADYCVNQDIIDQKIGEKISVVPILYDKKFTGWTYEEVYDYLFENAEKLDVNKLLKQILDEHLEVGDDDGDSEGEDGDGKGKRPRISASEAKEIRDEIREAVLSAAQSAGVGNVPGNIKRMIKDLTQPVMDWRSLLQQQIESTVKQDSSWLKTSRRSWHIDAILPGTIPGQTIDVCVAIDTSGSITENDLKIFLSEVKGIMESYDEYRINVITWDTSVYNPQEFTSDNMTDIMEYQPGGGGGTDPHCVWEWLKKNNIEPKKLIMFTDYCFGAWNPREVENYAETVWIIKGNPSARPEFGVYAHYEEKSKSKK